jgi:hypothetical protein
LALFAITGGVVLPPDEPPPEPVEPPEVPELPEPLLPPELPEPVDPPEVPELPDPLVLPELLDPPALPDPVAPAPLEPVEPLAVEVDDCPVLSPLLPPHAVIANAMMATSNPLRTNDVFMMKQVSLG